MASLVTNDFGRPPRRGHRVRAVLRAIAGCVVLIAAAHAVRDVAPPAFEGILRTFGVRQLCAAVPDVTPCPDGEASEPEASRAADTASTSAGTSELPRWSDGALAWPERYRQWILVGTSLGLGYSDAAGGHESFHHVYLTPRAYAEYPGARHVSGRYDAGARDSRAGGPRQPGEAGLLQRPPARRGDRVEGHGPVPRRLGVLRLRRWPAHRSSPGVGPLRVVPSPARRDRSRVHAVLFRTAVEPVRWPWLAGPEGPAYRRGIPQIR